MLGLCAQARVQIDPAFSSLVALPRRSARTVPLPLRRSIARLMGVDIPVPDFSTLSRCGLGLRLPAKPRVDSPFSQATRPMTAPRPEICSRRVLAMQSRSSFHRQKTPFSPCRESRDDPALRDQHIAQIQTYGRLAWQVRSAQSAQSRGSTNWSLEKCDRAETEIAAVRKSEN